MSKKVEIKVPTLGESVSEATIASWLKNPGEAVAQDAPILELETDKVTLEVMAPVSGVLADQAFDEGAAVEVNQVLGHIEEGVAANKASAPVNNSKAKAAPTQDAAPPAEKPQGPDPRVEKSGPAVRHLVAENNLNTRGVAASGKEDRLTKMDVLSAMESLSKTTPQSPSLTSVPASAPAPQGREERVKMSRLRQRIAQRLKAAQNTAAMLTTFNEIDMSAAMDMRAKYKESFEKKYGVKLGFMSIFTKAALQALKETPSINAEIDGQEVIYKHYYHMGVAVGTPQGLVVPVIRDVDQLNMAGIEKRLQELAIKARDAKLSMEDMSGGTFTISNGGVYGSLLSTPILNPPQTGILGLHKIQNRPIAVGKEVVIRPMMYVALSYDHRLIDGKEAVTFLVRVKECLEDPERLLLGV